MNINESFGDWLRQRRKNLDLTQAELADQVACSVVMIRKIEANERRPSKQISERMADVLAISLDERDAFINFARRVEHSLSQDLADLNPVSNLPAQSTPFIGRESELTQIADRLSDPACRLLTLLGAGGIGKTRLALQAAADQISKFSDGVFFVSLTPVGSTTLIASAIASALQFSLYGQDDPDMQVVNHLRGKHILLVMDNYEHLLAGLDLLTLLLANVPRLKLLVTSRERLNVQEEWLLPLEGLPFDDAVSLFVQSARRIQPNFAPDDHQVGITNICHAVEGLPLGIELAASWLRMMSCQQIADQIKNDLSFLTTALRNVPERHRSLRAVFEHSWGLLSEIERNALMKLSVFRGGIDAEAADHIACASLLLLAGLVDKSLVRLNTSCRYEMHELLRQFAADKLLESGQEAETRTCHLQFFLNLAELLEKRLFGPQGLESIDRLEIEHDNFRAALNWASQMGDIERGIRLASALGSFWELRTHWSEGKAWFEKFLAESPQLAVPIRARAFNYAILLNQNLGGKNLSFPLCVEAMALVHELEDQHLKAWIINHVGCVGYPNLSESNSYLKQALEMFRIFGDQRGICEVLNNLAHRSFQSGDFATAGKILDEGIMLARRAGDKSRLAASLMLTACMKWYQGNIDQDIEKIYQESLTLFHELRYKLGIAVIICQYGKLARLHSENARAKAFFEHSLLLTQQIGNEVYMTINLVNLAEIFCIHNEPERGTCIIGAVTEPIQKYFASEKLGDKEVRMDYERICAAAHAQLDEVSFAAAFAEGQRMTLDEVVVYTLADNVYAKAE